MSDINCKYSTIKKGDSTEPGKGKLYCNSNLSLPDMECSCSNYKICKYFPRKEKRFLEDLKKTPLQLFLKEIK